MIYGDYGLYEIYGEVVYIEDLLGYYLLRK